MALYSRKHLNPLLQLRVSVSHHGTYFTFLLFREQRPGPKHLHLPGSRSRNGVGVHQVDTGSKGIAADAEGCKESQRLYGPRLVWWYKLSHALALHED